MAPRSIFDPLASTGEVRWLVTSDMLREPIDIIELAPNTDLVRALSDAKQNYLSYGWAIDVAETGVEHFFMDRSGMRMEVGIQQLRPNSSKGAH